MVVCWLVYAVCILVGAVWRLLFDVLFGIRCSVLLFVVCCLRWLFDGRCSLFVACCVLLIVVDNCVPCWVFVERSFCLLFVVW